jgi:hypothetical protein
VGVDPPEPPGEQPAAVPTVPAASTGGGWPVADATDACAFWSPPTAVLATGAGSLESALQLGGWGGGGGGAGWLGGLSGGGGVSGAV